MHADTTLGMHRSVDLKVLGVLWNPQEDSCLKFSISDIVQAAADMDPTKRNIVSIIGRFYDPLGL